MKEFHLVCDMMRPRGVTQEQLNLKPFPFSLKDVAKDWLYYLLLGSIHRRLHCVCFSGIVLRRIVSSKSIEVDKAKKNIIANLPYPENIREVYSFLGTAEFYRRFIKDYSKNALPLSSLLKKDVVFNFNKECKEAFDTLKEKLTSTPILQPPRWDLPFEIMCDASNLEMGSSIGTKS
ncbi:uncharacterized mitochondrial protein AtMg00860-like [Benincasa hispida]|uniref:uncharacterized mitochondrial protein AtMg00860-like n=1 Tax=Benincasa hispida TaxID=102211 RepID=UPI0019004D22|nr:uncharacterized mitochondrial protein AtMg00860-like [Benincasa hispida]